MDSFEQKNRVLAMTDIEFRIEEIKEEIRKINAEKQRLEEELRELTLRNNTKKILNN